MAQKIGNVPVGTILHLKENGVYQDYIVVHHGLPGAMYDSSCNGTWMLRKKILSLQKFNQSSGGLNDFPSSIVASYLENTYIRELDSDIQSVISQVKIPYVKYESGNPIASGSNGFPCKAFVLGGYEVGFTEQYERLLSEDGAKLSYFTVGTTSAANNKRIANFNSNPNDWFLRTPEYGTANSVHIVTTSGGIDGANVRREHGVRPSIIFPSDLLVDDNNNILAATYPTPPSTITVPTSAVPTGSSIAVSWSAVSGAESYRLQRSVDGGAWETVYTGTQTSFSDTAGVWNSVKYQVATVKVGIVSGYTTSSNVTILPYVISRLTVPSQIMEGQSIPISWSAADGATTYILERKANSGSWTQIYSGANLSYTDTPSSSWSAVQYRVKGGKGGQYGTYKTSASIPVISASALVISGTDGYLGTLTADIAYTVSSDTGNPITVERYVNGQLVATVTVQSGFAYTIPVMDLPVGAGSIKITASVQVSTGGTVSASRNWTYTKTAINFPTTGGVAQLSMNGQNVFPPTLAECVRVPTVWGGTMDKALELLLPVVNSAVIQVGTYEGTGTFGQDNPNKLTFDDTPLVVTVYGGGQTLVISSTDTSSQAYIDGNTAKWYSTENAAAQMNVSGTTYSYVTVGKGQVSA